MNPLCTLALFSHTRQTSTTWSTGWTRLTPTSSKLVKQIEVAAATVEQDAYNKPYVKLLGHQQQARHHHRQHRWTLDVLGRAAGVQRKDRSKVQRRRRPGAGPPDGREIYAHVRVGTVKSAPKAKGKPVPGTARARRRAVMLSRGADAWGDVDASAVQREMIRRTIKEHLDKEKRLRPLGVKVLSLFFIDAVERSTASTTTEGNAGEGRLRLRIFEEEYQALGQATPTTKSLFNEVDLSSTPPMRCTTATSPSTRRRWAARWWKW